MEEILKALIQSNHRKVSSINVRNSDDKVNRSKYHYYDDVVKKRLIDDIRYELTNDYNVEKLEHKMTDQIEYSLELFVFNREQIIKLITEILEYGSNNSN